MLQFIALGYLLTKWSTGYLWTETDTNVTFHNLTSHYLDKNGANLSFSANSTK